jgi:hypothetical protein
MFTKEIHMGPDGYEERTFDADEHSAAQFDELDIADRLADEARDTDWIDADMEHAKRMGAVFDQFLDRLMR